MKYNINIISFFLNFQKKIIDNVKIIIVAIFCIIIVVISFQFYFYNKNKKILELSILFNNSIKTDSQLEFLENMTLIRENKNLYGLMASLEIINYNLKKENYDESYEDYILLLNNKNINTLYITFITIHASYNLLDKIDSEKILNLLTYVDKSLESFTGHYFEILYMLSLTQDSNDKIKSLYNEIINHDKISSSIKERVRKLNEFKKYK